MTEYDFSPEAYDRYMQTQNRVASWVHQTEQHRQIFEAAAPGAPGIPPVIRQPSPVQEHYPLPPNDPVQEYYQPRDRQSPVREFPKSYERWAPPLRDQYHIRRRDLSRWDSPLIIERFGSRDRTFERSESPIIERFGRRDRTFELPEGPMIGRFARRDRTFQPSERYRHAPSTSSSETSYVHVEPPHIKRPHPPPPPIQAPPAPSIPFPFKSQPARPLRPNAPRISSGSPHRHHRSMSHSHPQPSPPPLVTPIYTSPAASHFTPPPPIIYGPSQAYPFPPNARPVVYI